MVLSRLSRLPPVACSMPFARHVPLFRLQRGAPQMQQAVAAFRPTRQGRRVGGVTVRAAMFDQLSRGLDSAWKLVSNEGRLSKENMVEPLKEVRRALLEADVSVSVVRSFVKRVEEKAVGQEVIVGVTPSTAFIKLVNDELVTLMGGTAGSEKTVGLEPGYPQVVLLAGLQGVGKTTMAAKLAVLLRKQNKKVLLVAVDVYRPAAIDQLVKLGSSIEVPVFQMGTEVDPVEIARKGMEEARRIGADAVIVDTAGRLQVDGAMMTELKAIKAAVRPTDTLLVVDAMTGQEAAGLVKTFNDEINISGAILTKLDGDSRGGAALSVWEVSGKPIKFVGVGEKMDMLEPFFPDRMASRILGRGDVLTLFDKAQAAFTQDEAARTEARVRAGTFDFNDFVVQMKAISNMGGMQTMKLLPGFSGMSDRQLYEAEKKFKMYVSIIGAMPAQERENPDLLASSPAARKRLAVAAGRTDGEVTTMLNEFAGMRKQARDLAKLLNKEPPGADGGEAQIKEILTKQATPQKEQSTSRRKKDKAPKPVVDKSKGFGALPRKK